MSRPTTARLDNFTMTTSPSIMQCAPPFRRVDQTFMGGSRDAGKLRIREAYARILESSSSCPAATADVVAKNDASAGCCWYIVPDALAWRMYLPWITQLVTLLEQQQQRQSAIKVQFVLLESVTQDLEFRNQFGYNNNDNDDNQRGKRRPEVAFPQERIRLTRLLQQHSTIIRPFCDLSVRDADFDEWEDIAHEPHRTDRLRALAVRAARMLQWQTNHSSDNNDSTPQVGLWLHQMPMETLVAQQQDQEGVHFVEPHGILDILIQQCQLVVDVPADLDRLRLQCQDDYTQRQQQPATSPAADNSQTTTLSLTQWQDESQIAQGIREGILGKGRFQVSKENPAEAFCSWQGTMWFIASSPVVRAIDQDVVVIQPLPEPEWQQPVGRRRLVAVAKVDDKGAGADADDDDNATTGTATAATSTEASLSVAAAATRVPTARLLRIHQTGPRRVVVATLTDEPTLSDEAAVLVVPMDIRIPKIRLQSRQWHKWANQRLLVQIDAWDVDSRYPAGHVTEILGPVGDLETEITCLLTEHRIPMDPWSLQSRACLPRHDWTIPPQEIIKRRDLRRTHNIFSVDPVGCQDIDDCMHARRLPNGGIEVGVHIADVTHFVPLNSPLDLQARKRGTTFYLVDRRFDMLPSVLSSNLCSLHGGCDRLAVSVIWTLTEDMSQILSTWYGRTVIHNVAAMTYEQADRILAGEWPEAKGERTPPPLTAGAPVRAALIPKLKEDLGILTRLARQRRRDRADYGGAVDLSSGETGTELKFLLVDGEPVKVQPKETKEIHRTIEELMIWANTSVASKIKETFPDSALLRIHRAVEEDSFDDLKSLLTAGDIEFKGKTNAELAESLQRAQERSEKTVASLFRSLATRAMSEALYVSTASIGSAERLAHYGLGLKEYTHFTSPIRRYADVIVHHQLLAALEAKDTPDERRMITAEPSRNPVLACLPDSTVLSVLETGLAQITDDENDLEFDQFIGDEDSDAFIGASSSASTSTSPQQKHEARRTIAASRPGPFSGGDVAEICNHLNEHNRLAKHSSMDCQGLFLSLYFRNNVEYTQAVVTDLRENGFYCYVPKFDMRGPVYLRDKEGNVQMDPALFNLPRLVGADPTRAFASTDFIRSFGPSESEVWYKENESLEVFVLCRPFSLHPLDVVMVAITCPDWDNRARVPSPSIQLIHRGSEKVTMVGPSKGVTSKRLSQSRPDVKASLSKDSGFTPRDDGPSLFDLMEQIPQMALSAESRSLTENAPGISNQTVAGRLIWGGFVNPDSRTAAQAAAQEAAAALRTERQPTVNEYDANYRIAREVTSRQQRLAAEKRNTRRGKRN